MPEFRHAAFRNALAFTNGFTRLHCLVANLA
jgi:hypothetical protein